MKYLMDILTYAMSQLRDGNVGYGLYMPSSGCIPRVVVSLYGPFESFPPGYFLHCALIPLRWGGHVSEQVTGPEQMIETDRDKLLWPIF